MKQASAIREYKKAAKAGGVANGADVAGASEEPVRSTSNQLQELIEAQRKVIRVIYGYLWLLGFFSYCTQAVSASL